jgi:integrase
MAGELKASVSSILRNHVLPHFGPRPIGSVRRSDVEAWARSLPLSPVTLTTARQHLGTMFLAAVEDGLIARSPVTGARTPRPEKPPVVSLTAEQVYALVASAPAELSAMVVVVGAGAGLRAGEALGLAQDRVDWLRRSLRVDRQAVTLPSGSTVLAPPKTAASHRTIPLGDVVLEALAEHVRQHGVGEQGVLFHRDGALLAPTPSDGFGDPPRHMPACLAPATTTSATTTPRRCRRRACPSRWCRNISVTPRRR